MSNYPALHRLLGDQDFGKLCSDYLRQHPPVHASIRWFGDAMLQQAVEINDLKRASVVDLLRLLDYPSEHVPVLTGRVTDRDEPVGQIHVLDKAALNARLAHTYLNELKERARIV